MREGKVSRTEPVAGLSGLQPASMKARKDNTTLKSYAVRQAKKMQPPLLRTEKVQVMARALEKLAKAAELRASQAPRAEAASPAPILTPGPSAVQISSPSYLAQVSGPSAAQTSSPSAQAQVSGPSAAQTSSPSARAQVSGPLAVQISDLLAPVVFSRPATRAQGPTVVRFSRRPTPVRGPAFETGPLEPGMREPSAYRNNGGWRPLVDKVHTLVNVDVCLHLDHRDGVLPSVERWKQQRLVEILRGYFPQEGDHQLITYWHQKISQLISRHRTVLWLSHAGAGFSTARKLRERELLKSI